MKKFIEPLILATVIGIGALWLMAPSAQADEPRMFTQTGRDDFACPGMHAEWLDDKTVQCLRERP